MGNRFNLQGHRGARGLRPENTLPSFEVAFDVGVTSIETDVHLTRDGVPVLLHDATISDRLCRLLPAAGSPDPSRRPLVRQLTLAELLGYAAERNPELAALAAEAKGRASAVELARLAYVPDLELSFELQGSMERMLMGAITLPLQVPRIRAGIDEAKAMRRAAQAALRAR